MFIPKLWVSVWKNHTNVSHILRLLNFKPSESKWLSLILNIYRKHLFWVPHHFSNQMLVERGHKPIMWPTFERQIWQPTFYWLNSSLIPSFCLIILHIDTNFTNSNSHHIFSSSTTILFFFSLSFFLSGGARTFFEGVQ